MRPRGGQRRPTRLADVVDEVLGTVEPSLRREISFEAGKDVEAEVDRRALRTIVTNLVENALLYGAPPVLVSVAPWRGRSAALVVEDRGRGVAPQFVPQLFSAFARSEQSKLEGGGAGLGLAISSLLARLDGGQLLYEPVDPHGARFRLVLPLAEVAADTGARERAEARPVRTGLAFAVG